MVPSDSTQGRYVVRTSGGDGRRGVVVAAPKAQPPSANDPRPMARAASSSAILNSSLG